MVMRTNMILYISSEIGQFYLFKVFHEVEARPPCLLSTRAHNKRSRCAATYADIDWSIGHLIRQNLFVELSQMLTGPQLKLCVCLT